VHPKAIYEWLR